MDATVFLAFVEGLLRDTEDGHERLDAMYAEARPKPAPAKSKAARRAEIARFARLTNGDFA